MFTGWHTSRPEPFGQFSIGEPAQLKYPKDCSTNNCRELNVAITLRRDDQQAKQDSDYSNGPKPMTHTVNIT